MASRALLTSIAYEQCSKYGHKHEHVRTYLRRTTYLGSYVTFRNARRGGR